MSSHYLDFSSCGLFRVFANQVTFGQLKIVNWFLKVFKMQKPYFFIIILLYTIYGTAQLTFAYVSPLI